MILRRSLVKTKRRSIDQEKYFLARIAVNDAQCKKEYLKTMASAGLQNIGVEVDYHFIPPRCFVMFDQEEVDKQVEGLTEMLNELKETQQTSGEEPVLTKLPEDPSKGVGASVASSPESWVQQTEPDDSLVEPSHIWLIDDATQTNTNAPPVRFEIILPHASGNGTKKVLFVVDDYWEFAQIKFDDLATDFLQDFHKEAEALGNSNYEIPLNRFDPDVQELTRICRKEEAERSHNARAMEEFRRRREENSMSLIR